jgi:hypothetical protein
MTTVQMELRVLRRVSIIRISDSNTDAGKKLARMYLASRAFHSVLRDARRNRRRAESVSRRQWQRYA